MADQRRMAMSRRLLNQWSARLTPPADDTLITYAIRYIDERIALLQAQRQELLEDLEKETARHAKATITKED